MSPPPLETQTETDTMTTTLTTTVEDAVAIAPLEDLREEASHWLQVAVDCIPLHQLDAEDCAMALWSIAGGRYRGLPEWMQDALRAAWADREPVYTGKRLRRRRVQEEQHACWERAWADFVEGRHDT